MVQQRANAQQRVARLEQLLAELGARIEAIPIDDIREREASRKKKARELADVNQKLGECNVRWRQASDEEDKLKRLQNSLASKNKKAKGVVRRRELVVGALQLLDREVAAYETEARSELEQRVNEILETVAHKDFAARLGDDYELDLLLTGKATAKSAGENQLLSLAFIAALVRFAADREDDDDSILKPGVVAPLILDAPLGQLDPMYQVSVAKFLPTLADQVVLLLSGSQGSDRVIDALRPYVGAEYVVIQQNKGRQGKKPPLTRMINGKEFNLIEYESERTQSRIERIA
jgi:DNA sulfur modification protein DndD